MPHVNIWIRKEDYEVWQRIRDKPGFLRASLRAMESTGNMRKGADLLDKVSSGQANPIVLGILESVPQVQGLKFCKHGLDPKMCKYAKPEKPCK